MSRCWSDRRLIDALPRPFRRPGATCFPALPTRSRAALTCIARALKPLCRSTKMYPNAELQSGMLMLRVDAPW